MIALFNLFTICLLWISGDAAIRPSAFVAYFEPHGNNSEVGVHHENAAAPWVYVILPLNKNDPDTVVVLVPDLPVFQDRKNVDALQAAVLRELEGLPIAANLVIERLPTSAIRRRKQEAQKLKPAIQDDTVSETSSDYSEFSESESDSRSEDQVRRLIGADWWAPATGPIGGEAQRFDPDDVARSIQRAVTVTPSTTSASPGDSKKKSSKKSKKSSRRTSDKKDKCGEDRSSSQAVAKAEKAAEKAEKRRMKEEKKNGRKEGVQKVSRSWNAAVDTLESVVPAIAPSGARGLLEDPETAPNHPLLRNGGAATGNLRRLWERPATTLGPLRYSEEDTAEARTKSTVRWANLMRFRSDTPPLVMRDTVPVELGPVPFKTISQTTGTPRLQLRETRTAGPTQVTSVEKLPDDPPVSSAVSDSPDSPESDEESKTVSLDDLYKFNTMLRRVAGAVTKQFIALPVPEEIDQLLSGSSSFLKNFQKLLSYTQN